MNDAVQQRTGRYFGHPKNAQKDFETHVNGNYLDFEFHIFPGATSRAITSEDCHQAIEVHAAQLETHVAVARVPVFCWLV